MKYRISRIIRLCGLISLPVLGILSILGTGGGGGEVSWLYPLWVPTDIVLADIDHDGRNDILTATMLSRSSASREGHIDVYRQIDQGNFSGPDTYVVGENPWHLDVIEIDDDGLPDLLVTDPDLENFQLLLQNPDSIGEFLPPSQIAANIYSYTTAVADFNDDGATDIAIGEVSNMSVASNRVVMLYQDPSQPGAFLPPEDFIMPGTSTPYVTTGDIDDDGLADLFAWINIEPSGNTPNGLLAFSLQQPDGSLGPVTTLAPQTGLNVDYLAIADYDGDGANDLFAFFRPFSSNYKAKLTVLLQEAVPGTFGAPVDTSLAGIKGIDDAVVADLNDDGRPDFAVVGFFPEGSPSVIYSRLNIFLQSVNGAFSFTDYYSLPINGSIVAAGDINNDGLNDLAVLGGDNEGVYLLQSQAAKGTFISPVSF